MRFAYAGYDDWRVVFDAFIASGWEAIALYTMPLDNRIEFNREIVERAERLRIPVQLSRIHVDDLRTLARRQCDALVVAGYSWRIPDWHDHLRYAVNFHPSPLPEGRGPYPLVSAILEDRPEWGISCHRIDNNFDTGELLASETVALQPDDWHETLQLKLQMAAKRLASRTAQDFENLWKASRSQEGGSYFPRFDEAKRTLDFKRPVADTMRMLRAFGLLECIAPMRDAKVFVKRATVWQEAHDYIPGEIVHESNRHIVIAAIDGFVALLEWSFLDMSLRSRVGP